MSNQRFGRVLVANRGEIAVRIMRTARSLGYGTVAVYSDADADAPHVKAADQAVRLGGSTAAESYLRADAILEAAARTGADALHPGYGFLAENAEFAQQCADADVVFIGPSPSAIAAMGDKVVAKRRMIEAGVPCAPGYEGDANDTDALTAAATKLGVPLLVKAVAGGGGRGMRKVVDLAQLPAAIEGARNEAASAFGNGALFLERLVLGARHVEVQVFADTHGNVIHLGERECSAQRRHQKIIEEAPSPVVSPQLRAKMGEAAVAAARAIDYVGAGTVEFLLDDDGEFYFLEMNTRLQVEHPVTELVTGTDLVAWQLAVAQGEALPSTQSEVVLEGHAIEARLYAEDPAAGFLPQTGRLLAFDTPSRDGVRFDTGIETGDEVSAFYDPMVAKVIAHGPDRETARRRLLCALRETSVMGLTCNRAYLVALLGDPMFVAGQIKTDTIDSGAVVPSGGAATPSVEQWSIAATMRAGLEQAGGWRSSESPRSIFALRHGDDAQIVDVERVGPDRVRVRIGEHPPVELRIRSRSGLDVRVEVGGVERTVRHLDAGPTLYLHDGGNTFEFAEPNPAQAEDAAADGVVVAPLSGRVLAVKVADGDAVEAGDTLVVVEAMKMEHRLEAPRGGVVTGLTVKEGEQVTGKERLLIIEEES